MLRSVGLDKKGLCHLLYTEGFLLVIKPLLIGISILILVSTILIWLQDITVIEFLKVFPFWGGSSIYHTHICYHQRNLYGGIPENS